MIHLSWVFSSFLYTFCRRLSRSDVKGSDSWTVGLSGRIRRTNRQRRTEGVRLGHGESVEMRDALMRDAELALEAIGVCVAGWRATKWGSCIGAPKEFLGSRCRVDSVLA